MLYPLKFRPIFREKIWGGKKISTSLGIDFAPLATCGEAWTLSGVPGSQTVVTNGFLAGNDLNEILEIYMDELVGEKVFEKCKDEFPVLVKFIDANDWLSVQVHPDDAMAASQGMGNGKTEMWYILDADPGAKLVSGFSRKLDEETFSAFLEKKQIKEVLNFENVQKGDVFYIPSGRVHALGPGILLAEIQQTSDTTYRLFDWDRVDASGKSRELHTSLALKSIDFGVVESYRTTYRAEMNKTARLVDSPFFTTSLLDADREIQKDYGGLDSFVIYICVEGRATLVADEHRVSLTKGEVLLLPAVINEVTLIPDPNIRILEVYIP